MSREAINWLLIAATILTLSPVAVYLDALLGGWRTLAAKYPGLAKQRPGGLRLGWQTINLENGGSRNGATVAVHRDGMQLEMPLPILRLLYPSMFLPGKEIISAVRVRWVLVDCVRLTFAKSPDEPITIYTSLERKIFNVVGPVWSYAIPSGIGAESTVASKLTATQRL